MFVPHPQQLPISIQLSVEISSQRLPKPSMTVLNNIKKYSNLTQPY